MNASYLSELFKKEEGITISEYILQEKLKLVKNMLIYSRYSYIEIANCEVDILCHCFILLSLHSAAPKTVLQHFPAQPPSLFHHGDDILS